MSRTLLDRAVAAGVFSFALVLYLSAMAPTVSFWDAGEFIASVHGLQVMHPPGAPFYMLLGHLFSMFVPAGWVAFSVNLVSVLASAFTVLLTYLVIVRLVRRWQPPVSEQTGRLAHVVPLVGGVVGACVLAVTDSFWFNAVEAEVYALSMFFTALVVWLALCWSDEARRENLRTGRHPFALKANRYLVLIAYLFGLAIGVHLLSLLALFFVALIVFFTAYDRETWSARHRLARLVAAGLASVGVFLLIYPVLVTRLPAWAGESGAPLLFLVGLPAAILFALYWTHRKKRPVLNLSALCLAMVLLGYSSYALIFIRSAADPPIDLMDPETSEAFASYLAREQYGGPPPLLTGPAFDDATGQVNLREETFFPRRYSWQPEHERVYARYDSDWEYFWKYQIGYMYVRYFMWNFAGRAGDVQGAPAITGFEAARQPVDLVNELRRTPSERESRNAYYLVPLLLGLFGAFFHARRDGRRAFAVFVLFLMTGVGVVIYLNQTPLQVRARDYAYVGSFFAFSLWIGIGAAGLLETAADVFRRVRGQTLRRTVLVGCGALLFLLPGFMARENYFDHDRSGQYLPRDFAYNLLMSVEEDSILFTYGDSDTYPLWYLQAVEGVRPDVRVVNLSLLNLPWYAKQLKHQRAYEAVPVPISFSDERLQQMPAIRWEPQAMKLPVDAAYWLEKGHVSQESRLERPMQWTLAGQSYGPDVNILTPGDQVAYNILRNVAEAGWERPVYFSVSTAPSSWLGLEPYLRLEGLAYRVVPVRSESEQIGHVAPALALKRWKRFRFTNLDDPDVYYNAVTRGMADNYYRRFSARLAAELGRQGKSEAGRALLERMVREVPFVVIPGDVGSFLLVARAYEALETPRQGVAVLEKAEPLVLTRLKSGASREALQRAVRQARAIRDAYLRMGAFEAAAAFSERLAEVLGDPTLRQTPEALRRAYDG